MAVLEPENALHLLVHVLVYRHKRIPIADTGQE